MKIRSAFLVAVVWASLTPAQAAPITDTPVVGGTMIVATPGPVKVTYLGSDAGYFSYLYFDRDDPLSDIALFDKGTAVGTTMDLGDFSAGTELTFRLYVSNTGTSFFTGEGSINPDRMPHVRAVTRFNRDGVFVTEVGFEDLLGGGDRDYNDFVFRLTNVYDPPSVPEPATLLLTGLGLAALGAVRRRKVRA